MPLEPGTSLGTYQVVSLLGRGGMGEVYRARDSKLGREVAIKILLADVSKDPPRLARFEREARVLASLNHPNVATLYGFERDGETGFLVMELVEGETLADRIAHGRIPVEAAIPLFLQIAEGLEAAHAKGVVHRDLKPANLKLTEAGRVKILDFGLAKAPSPERDSPVPSASQSPTLTLAATQRGEILGTTAYMSPEQARGLAAEADGRVDVWGFGCCLFEALSGERPFRGEDAGQTLASVLKDQPDWGRLPRSLPGPLVRLLRRCLEKRPADRLQSIGDARLELAELLSPSPASAPGETEAAPSPPGLRRAVPIAVTVAAVATVAAAWLWLGRPRAAAPTGVDAPMRLSLQLPPEVDVRSKAVSSVVAVSRDGRRLVFSSGGAGGRLWTRSLDSSRFEPIVGTEGAEQGGLAISPDGEWVTFNRDRAAWKIRIDGGEAVRVADRYLWRPHWADDGDLYLSGILYRSLVRVPADGGAEEEVLRVDESQTETMLSNPVLLPGGKTLLVNTYDGSFARGRIDALTLATGERRTLVEDGRQPAYIDSGHLLFDRDNSLHAVAFDIDALRVHGPEVPVVTDIEASGNYRDSCFAVSEAGTLVYLRSGQGLHNRRLVLRDRTGAEIKDVLRPGYFDKIQFTPNGSLGVLSMLPEGRRFLEIFTLDLSLGTLNQVTFDRVFNRGAVISPDGSFIVFASNLESNWNLDRIDVDGSNRRNLIRTNRLQSPSSISADGRFVAYREGIPRANQDLWVLPLEGESPEPIPVATSAALEHHAMFSPDGRWLAYTSDESGRPEVWLQSFDPEGGPSRRRQVSQAGGWMPVWAPDGSAVYFRSLSQNELMVASVRLAPELELGLPEVVFAPTNLWPPDPLMDQDYDVLADGSFIALVDQENPSTMVGVILNFDELLRREVPVESSAARAP